MSIIAALRTPVATLAVLCMALLAQLPHAADVFRMIVAGVGWAAVAHGYAYAVALELAVLLFVVQRRDAESYLFAGVSVLVNLSYYALHGIDLFSVAALPAWLVSIALPAAIARYSHLLVETPVSAEPTRTVAELPVEIAQEVSGTVRGGGANMAATIAENDGIDHGAITQATQPATPTQTARKPAQRKRKAAKATKLTPAQRRAQIAESGTLDASAITAQFGVSLRTAQDDIAAVRAGLVQVNGA